MPSALDKALLVLVWVAVIFLIGLLWWLYYCECQRWRASLERPAIALAQATTIPVWDSCRVG